MEMILFYFVIYCAEALIIFQYASNVFWTRLKLTMRIIILALLYGFLFALTFRGNFIMNTTSFLLCNFIFFYAAYQCRWKSALFHAAITTTIMGLSELVIYSLMSHFAPEFFGNSIYFRNLTILAVFSKILYFILVFILSQVLTAKQKQEKIPNQTSVYLIIVPIISVFVMLTFFAICANTKLNPNLDWMISLSSLALLLINILIFAINLHNQTKNREFTDLQLLLQKEYDTTEYYKMLLKQTENHNILIHDIKQHLQSIALLNQKHDYEKIDSYISQLVKSSDLQKLQRLCDNEILNMILYRYQNQCADFNIGFSIDIRANTVDYIAENDLTALFGNLLDNAFESSSQMPNGFIEIKVDSLQNTPYTIITVTNSCRRSPFVNNRLLTKKPNRSRHGFGIKSIERIVKKYLGNIKMYYEPDTLTFHSIITLKNFNHSYSYKSTINN